MPSKCYITMILWFLIICFVSLSWNNRKGPHINPGWQQFLPEASFGLWVLSLPPSVCPSVRHQVCPRDNSSPDQVRITKFGPQMQNTLVKFPIVLAGNWPWPSRSNRIPKSKFTPFWACPCHNSPPIEVTISEFGTKMHLSTIQISTNFGLD